MKLDDLIPIVI